MSKTRSLALTQAISSMLVGCGGNGSKSTSQESGSSIVPTPSTPATPAAPPDTSAPDSSPTSPASGSVFIDPSGPLCATKKTAMFVLIIIIVVSMLFFSGCATACSVLDMTLQTAEKTKAIQPNGKAVCINSVIEIVSEKPMVSVKAYIDNLQAKLQ